MTQESLAGQMGVIVTVDLCRTCQAFWFDTYESLRLSPAAVLKLFGIIGECSTSSPTRASDAVCPKCGAQLRLAHDLQRSTRFEYLKCPREHGRFITFFNFLREKDFVRPLSAHQIAALRENVQTINCSNCGAPIDLAATSTCAHCKSPVSMLDMKQAETLVKTLRDAGEPGEVDPSWPIAAARARRDVEAQFAQFEHESTWFSDVSSSGLVGAGLVAIGRWLKQDPRR